MSDTRPHTCADPDRQVSEAQRRDEIIRLRAEGATFRSIADRYGCPPSTIYNWINRAGRCSRWRGGVEQPNDDGTYLPLRDGEGRIIAWTRIDSERYDELAQHAWRLNAQGYATRTVGTAKRSIRIIRLHRVVLGEEVQVDHINRDKLDNRRENLRSTDSFRNAWNRDGIGRGSSRFVGVSFNKRQGKWRAAATYRGATVHLGYFDDELAAAEAAAKFRRENDPNRLPVAA
jgi:hypothetical protein